MGAPWRAAKGVAVNEIGQLRMKMQFTSESVDQTDAFGRALAQLLEPGDIVLLDGELGAGKTTLVRVIASAMGVQEGLVSSPTFVTINEYPARVPLVHVDAYRLSGAEELDTLGFDRAIAGEVVVLIEWACRLVAEMPTTGREIGIHMTHAGLTARTIAIEIPEAWTTRLGFSSLAVMMDTDGQ